MGKIERRLVRDLKNEYPEMEIEENADAADVLLELYAADENALKCYNKVSFLFWTNGILFFTRTLLQKRIKENILLFCAIC